MKITRFYSVLFICAFLFVLCGESAVLAQTANAVKINGTVKDEAKTTLPGVSIFERGTTNGTITDANGKYSLSVRPGSEIEFSCMGYVTEIRKIENSTTLDITLSEDTKMLDEVVVVGYGTMKKSDLTGSISTVNMKDTDSRSLTNAAQAIQGKVAGLSVTQSSGRPGDDDMTMRIRGVSSLDNNNDPLVIIDGVEGLLSDVHPNDIKNISVLKDAASAAIYGSRASAGVILIETKDAGTGLSVSYDGLFSVQQVTRLPEIAHSWDYAALRNEARKNVGLSPYYSETAIEKFKLGIDPDYPDNDWYSIYFKPAFMQNHYFSASVGGKNYRFFSSLSYLDQDGVLTGTGSKRLSFHSKFYAALLEKRLRFNMNVTGTAKDTDELISPTNTVMATISNMLPSTIFRGNTEDGQGLYSYSSCYLAGKEYGGGIDNDERALNMQGSIEIEPVKKLVGKILYSRNIWTVDFVRQFPEFWVTNNYSELSIQKMESSLTKSWRKADNTQLTATLNYDAKFGKHRLTFMAGYERLLRIGKYDEGQVKYLSINEPIFNYGDPNTPFLSSTAYEYATVSQFGRITWAYNDKYILAVNTRRDGSSRFSRGRRWGIFPSVSAAWRITNERFMRSLDFLDLKLRGSWGKLGNQNIGSFYASSDNMSGKEYYSFGGTIVPGRGTITIADPDITWETTEQINAGADITLWQRLSITADWYRKDTYNILAQVTIPPSIGVASNPYQNIGSMLNKGIELSVSYNSKQKKGFKYSLSGNFNYISNKVTNLGNLDFVRHSDYNRSVVGHPFASWYGYICDGILQVDDFTWQNGSDPSIPHDQRQYVLKDNLPSQSDVMWNPAPGDIKLRDSNGDGNITPDDKALIGNPIPKFYYGLNINLDYKGWNLNILGQGVAGVKAYMDGPLISPYYNAGTGGLLKSTITDRWTYEKPSGKYRRIYEEKTRDALITSYNLYDASYFRLKNVKLSYTLPQNAVKKIGVKQMSFFLSGENLFVLTGFMKGFDPERDWRNTRPDRHPQIAVYTIGVNIKI